MYRLAGVLLIAAALFGCSPTPEAAAQSPSPSPALSSDDEKTLYAMGAVLGQNVKALNLTPAEVQSLLSGLTDVATGKKEAVDMETWGPKIQTFVQARQVAASKIEAEKGKAFADKAAKEAGAETTASGLVVKTVQAGTGALPKPTDTVKVHYTGKLIDGTVFDSSVERGQPAEFPLSGVIPCWTEGLQKVKVGGKAQLVCPASIAYGDRGRPRIPGGATLVFDVELLDIVKAPAAPPAGDGAKQ